MKRSPSPQRIKPGLLGKINAGFYFRPFEKRGVWAAFTQGKENFSFRHGPDSEVIASRRNFLGRLKINYQDLVCLKQVHCANVVYAGNNELGRGAESYESAIANADAVFTDQKNLPLAIFIADCLGVYLFDFKNKVIGLAHAGWRPSAAGICLELIKALSARFGTKPKYLLVGFSPAIRSCCYEVGPDVARFFKHGLVRRNGKVFLDLIKENRQQILTRGVSEKNIFDCQICTSCNSQKLFSFRKYGEKCGRAMAVMMIK